MPLGPLSAPFQRSKFPVWGVSVPLRDLHDDRDRTPSSSIRGSHWFHDFRSLGDKFVLRHQSLDGYLFLRFFKLIILICSAGCCITWPILLPINATGGGGASQLDKLTFGNVNENDRLYAHAIVAWLFLGDYLQPTPEQPTDSPVRIHHPLRYTGAAFPGWGTPGISLHKVQCVPAIISCCSVPLRP
jgi:hypothetical protein